MSSTPRQTKIVATLGPSTDSPEVMRALIQAGVNVVRINFSHGSQATHKQRIEMTQSIAKELGKVVGVIADLQGPKIRIASFEKGSAFLKEGASFILDAALDLTSGDEHRVGLEYKALLEDANIGDILLLDDGLICLQVTALEGTQIITEVIAGGELGSKKGLNRKGGGLSAPTLTEKDLSDLAFIADLNVDYVALSFVKSAEDLHDARRRMKALNFNAHLTAKIERTEAILAIDEIIEASDAVMVARGDLGVELGYAELPGIQKMIIKKALEKDKVVITATQMMESMVKNPIPTRAEVSDVANAVLDGSDAVMLSAETATGKFPVQVVSIMHDICVSAEKQFSVYRAIHNLKTNFSRDDEAIAMSARFMADHLNVKAIVALTESGSTSLWMSRVHSSIPIYALSRHAKACGRMTLFRGVHPIPFDVTHYHASELTKQTLNTLVTLGLLALGDKAVLTKGNILGVGGNANTLKIVTAN
jgi:pyruvate kinase